MAARMDAWTWAGIGVAGTTAAVASAGAQHQLAVAAGWGSATGWLLPGCVDTLAVVAARVWLDTTGTDSARRYARFVALVAVAVSLTLNAAGHANAVGSLAMSVPLVVAVGAVPALSLAATVHLSAVRTAPVARRKRRRSDRAESAISAVAAPAAPVPAVTTAAATSSATDTAASRRASALREGARVTPIVPGDTATDRARHHWDHERARGRVPSGAELARVAQCSASMGRKLAATFRESVETATDERESR